MDESVKARYDAWITSEMAEIWDISKYIHANPELGFQEEKACRIQCEYLKQKGFDILQPVNDLNSAFVASFGNGAPVIAVFSEYDALKGLGHACGHNLIAASAILTGAAVKKYLEENDVKGTIKVFGTPAEESGGGKIKMLEKGVFSGVDAVFMMHPTSDKTRMAGACMSNMSLRVVFKGVSAHAGSHPDNGRNALSAANLYLNAVGLWRQHFKADMRVNHFVEYGGEMTNSIAEKVILKGELRSFRLKELHWLEKVMRECAHGCAQAMGCTVDFYAEEGYQGRVPNAALSDLCRREFEKLQEPMLDGMPDDYGGEDLGNVSRHIPICNPYVTIFPDHKISGHTDQFRELAVSQAGYRCIEMTGKAMTRSIIELLNSPDVLAKAKDELKQRIERE